MGILRKKLRRYTDCKHCFAVDLILKHNQKGSMLGRVWYIIYSTNMKPTLWRHMKRCHGHLHYDRKFKIFIFLIGYINVNKGVFCLIISYLRMKIYNVLNYNNCSIALSFPLNINIYSKKMNHNEKWFLQVIFFFIFDGIFLFFEEFCHFFYMKKGNLHLSLCTFHV